LVWEVDGRGREEQEKTERRENAGRERAGEKGKGRGLALKNG
jgi:hypothetical protein